MMIPWNVETVTAEAFPDNNGWAADRRDQYLSLKPDLPVPAGRPGRRVQAIALAAAQAPS